MFFPLFLGRYSLIWLSVTGSVHCCPGYCTGELFCLLLWVWGMSQAPQPCQAGPVPEGAVKRQLVFRPADVANGAFTGWQSWKGSLWTDHWESQQVQLDLNVRILTTLDCTWLLGLLKPNQHNQTNRKYAKRIVTKVRKRDNRSCLPKQSETVSKQNETANMFVHIFQDVPLCAHFSCSLTSAT